MANLRLLFVVCISFLSLICVVTGKGLGKSENALSKVTFPPGVHFGQEHSVQDLKQEIIQDMKDLSNLKDALENGSNFDNQALMEELRENTTLITNDVQFKWDFLKQIYVITKNVEIDLEKIRKRWKIGNDKEKEHLADSLLEGVDAGMNASDYLPDTNGLRSDDSFFNITTEEDMEQDEEYFDEKLFSEERTEEFVPTVNPTKMTISEDKTRVKRFITSFMPYTSRTSGWANRKRQASIDGAACAKRVQDKAEELADVIKEFHTMAGKAEQFRKAVDGLSNLLIPLSKLPVVGTPATLAQSSLKPVKEAIEKVEPDIQTIDKRLYPGVRQKLVHLTLGAGYLGASFKTAEWICGKANNNLNYIRECLRKSSSSYRGAAISFMENKCRDVFDASERPALDSSYSAFTSTCDRVDQELDKLKNAFNIPAFRSFRDILDDIINALGPIIDVFGEISGALDFEICFFGCFTVRDIIDGISFLLDIALGWLQDLIDEVLKGIGFELPNLPSLGIDFDFLFNFDINFDFSLSTGISFNFDFLDWTGYSIRLPGGLCASPYSFSIPSFKWPSFGKK